MPQVILHTSHGAITLALDAEKAPQTVENFRPGGVEPLQISVGEGEIVGAGIRRVGVEVRKHVRDVHIMSTAEGPRRVVETAEGDPRLAETRRRDVQTDGAVVDPVERFYSPLPFAVEIGGDDGAFHGSFSFPWIRAC